MNSGDQNPYLSVVATSRNDNHGGNLLHRMQLFVNGFVNQCNRHNLRAELALVEWNPPPDKPRLAEALRWPANGGACNVRIIEVSPEIHKRFKYSDRLPLFQMIAKNAGIRRARGPFVLATNIDVLFSDELMSFLAAGRLKKGCVYRIDRYDVPPDIEPNTPIEDQLEFCRNNAIRVSTREGTLTFKTGHFHVANPAMNWRRRLKGKLQDLGVIPVTSWALLHTNACGDFTLMDRERWFALHGYPELEMFSFHLDSLLCFAAHHSGAREMILRDPARIYHVEHSAGSGFTPEAEQAMYKRIGDAGISRLHDDDWMSLAVQMRREKKPIIFSKDNWGLVDENLPETSVYKK